MAGEHLETLGGRRVGRVERWLGRLTSGGAFWEPGPLYVYLRAERRRRFLGARWEFWVGWGYPLLVLLACAIPPLWVVVLLAPLASFLCLEMTAAGAASRVRSGLARDLYLAGESYHAMRADLLAFAGNRSMMPVVMGVVVVAVALVFSGNMVIVAAAQASRGMTGRHL